jgi:monothiol glutaredoxin
MPLSDTLRADLQRLVSDNDVVLFMKGTRRSPACGFSARVVAVLDEHVPTYLTVDVLADAALRDGIKEFSSWPTIPQLYVKGQFVGGADIVAELQSSGELGALLGGGAAKEPPKPPTVTLTKAAAEAFRGALADADGEVLHLSVSARFEHELFVGPPEKGELVVRSEGIVLHVDPASARRAEGLCIDFRSGEGGGFAMDNPNEPPKVRPLAVRELAEWMAQKKAFALFDVRTRAERDRARIEGAILLDDEGEAALAALPKDTTLVFQCHHGIRSRAAAEQALLRGFARVWNLTGGIDAWSREVDSKVPLY